MKHPFQPCTEVFGDYAISTAEAWDFNSNVSLYRVTYHMPADAWFITFDKPEDAVACYDALKVQCLAACITGDWDVIHKELIMTNDKNVEAGIAENFGPYLKLSLWQTIRVQMDTKRSEMVNMGRIWPVQLACISDPARKNFAIKKEFDTPEEAFLFWNNIKPRVIASLVFGEDDWEELFK